ncbi:MAG: dephospho-CoA kinase [Persicimonas sp.]
MGTVENFVIVGLTGGIASGKSTVAAMLEDLGTPVIDADQIAREVVEPGEPALEEIREAFGEEVIDEDGALDRPALGEVVFGDANARKRLEAITHPRIGQRMMERANELREADHRWVVYDAALIVENGMHRWLDSLIVVAADPEVQLDRLLARDDISAEQAQSRIDSQMPLEDKITVADYVVDNNGTLEDTRRQVEDIHTQIDEAVRTRGTAKPERKPES